MARLIILAFCLGLLLAGCQKKKEDVEALKKETGETTADSIAAAGVDTMAQKALAAQPKTAAEPDYSQLKGYVVQIGSYATYDFARATADKYVGRDYPAFVVSKAIDGKTYYRVRLGVYEKYAEAKQIGELVKDRYSADFWIDSN